MQTLTKKSPSDICHKPKKLYKLYNAKQINLKEHRKKFRNKILKLLNYTYLLTKNKYLNVKKNSNKFYTKPKEKICFLPLSDLSNLNFSIFFEEDIE
jgi:hypothetical protein